MASKHGKIAARYARALLSTVGKGEKAQSGKLTKAQTISAELESFSNLWESDKEVSSLLISPMYKKEQRKAALDAALKEVKFSKTTSDFIKLIFQRERIAALPEISEIFSKLADDDASVLRVNITTARKIDAGEVSEVEKVISNKLSGEPQFNWAVEPEMLGGMKIEYSGKIIDGSISAELERFERQLKS